MTATTTNIVATDRDLQPPLYAKRDIALVRGAGATLWDSDGREYIDVMSNYGVNVLGHAHPAVTAAITEQAGCCSTSTSRSPTTPARSSSKRCWPRHRTD